MDALQFVCDVTNNSFHNVITIDDLLKN